MQRTSPILAIPPRARGREANAAEPLETPHCITRGLKQSCGTGLVTRQNGPAGQDSLHDWNGPAFDKAKHERKVNEWATECATHIFPSKNRNSCTLKKEKNEEKR